MIFDMRSSLTTETSGPKRVQEVGEQQLKAGCICKGALPHNPHPPGVLLGGLGRRGTPLGCQNTEPSAVPLRSAKTHPAPRPLPPRVPSPFLVPGADFRRARITVSSPVRETLETVMARQCNQPSRSTSSTKTAKSIEDH